MTEKQMIEAEEVDVEHLPEETETSLQTPVSGDHMDRVIEVSKRIDDYSKAMDTIQNHIIKRSYAGDWVCHARATEAMEDKKANIGAAAAERIASFLGIREANWRFLGKTWSDDKKHYTYEYQADFTFGGRTVTAIGRAGTRDVFFGKSHGQWKPLEDIQEDDIKKAAFRATRKEGVRTLLGLRNIPLSKLKDLGYNLSLIKMVDRRSGPVEANKSTEPVKKDNTVRQAKGSVTNIFPKKSKNGKDMWVLELSDGNQYSFFGGADSKRAETLKEMKTFGVETEIGYTVAVIGGNEYRNLATIDGESHE